MKKRSVALLLSIVLLFSLGLSGCGGGGVSDEGVSEETFTWKVQAYTATGTTFYDYAKHLCDSIVEMSNGRIQIDFYGAGELVEAFDVPNAIRDGILDAEYGYAGLWTSVEYGMPLFCSTPGEFSDPFDVLYWLEYGGGMDIWREAISSYDCTVFPGGVLDAENFLWADIPIQTVEDLRSLKLRMMPVAGDILAANGCSVVFLPGGEIISSMERQVIDAGEYSTSALDETFGFQDVAQYYHKPGFHQPTSIQEFVISNRSFDALPDDLKAIVEAACTENVMWTWMENGVRNQAANVRFKEMGREQVVMPEELVTTLQEWTNVWFEEQMQSDPFIAEVRNSQIEFMQWWVPYKEDMHIPYAPWAYERAGDMPYNFGE